jgi:hypothetical protein
MALSCHFDRQVLRRVCGGFLPADFDPQVLRKMCGGFLSAALHFGLLLVILLPGGRHGGVNEGDTPVMKVVLVEARDADRREGDDLPPLEPAVPKTPDDAQLQAAIAQVAPPPADLIPQEPQEEATPPATPPEAAEPVAIYAITPPVTVPMSPAEQAAISKRLARLAEKTLDQSQMQVVWEEDGKQYSALLIRERANDGTALERVLAEVSASDRGKQLTTRINLKRLAFSQFTQMVDRWDPMVQLHDDEIVGRFHSNSQFNVMYDSRTAPKFLGKVTTAARSFDTESRGRRRDSDIFRGGVETLAGRIPLPEDLAPFEWAPRNDNVRVHEIANDTRIRFFADGTYTLRNGDSSDTQYVKEPSEQPIYFVAMRGVTLYVAGVVAGKMLVYSPQRIVIEDDLIYARDPREKPESRDYLGLVCDRYVEVAPPSVTGPGDLQIDAAIFAGRRFVVTNIDHARYATPTRTSGRHPRTATLRIYGSLAAGSLSATEPRYATKIDYDNRFERQRPPGFPSTNRYEVDDWDGQWTQTERSADDSF